MEVACTGRYKVSLDLIGSPHFRSELFKLFVKLLVATHHCLGSIYVIIIRTGSVDLLSMANLFSASKCIGISQSCPENLLPYNLFYKLARHLSYL